MKPLRQVCTPEMLEAFRKYCTRNNPEMIDPTYACHFCRDTGYEQVQDRIFDHMKYEMFDTCPHCERGQTIQRGRGTARMREKIKRYRKNARYDKDRQILQELERRIDAGQQLRPEDFRGLSSDDDEA
jgi:hypothetical protein